MADDVIEYDRLVFRRRIGARWRQEISRRVRPVVVVIADVLTDEIVEVLLAADQEIVQAFLLDALNHPFTACVEIRTLNGQFDRLEILRLKDVVEIGGELGIAIADQMLGLVVEIVSMHEEVAGLLLDPGGVGVQRCGRGEDFEGLQIDEHQYEGESIIPRRDIGHGGPAGVWWSWQ